MTGIADTKQQTRRNGMATPIAVALGASVAATSPAGVAIAAEPACTRDAIIATLCVTADLTGAATLQGTAPMRVVSPSCGEWARGGRGADRGQPKMDFTVTIIEVGAIPFGMMVRVDDYAGPGVYEGKQLAGRAGPFAVLIGDDAFASSPNANDDSAPVHTSRLDIAADGSGRLTLSGLVKRQNLREGGRGDGSHISATEPTLSGTVSWACLDPIE